MTAAELELTQAGASLLNDADKAERAAAMVHALAAAEPRSTDNLGDDYCVLCDGEERWPRAEGEPYIDHLPGCAYRQAVELVARMGER